MFAEKATNTYLICQYLPLVMVGVSAQPKLKSLCVTRCSPESRGPPAPRAVVCGRRLCRSFMIRVKVKRVLMKSICWSSLSSWAVSYRSREKRYREITGSCKGGGICQQHPNAALFPEVSSCGPAQEQITFSQKMSNIVDKTRLFYSKVSEPYCSMDISLFHFLPCFGANASVWIPHTPGLEQLCWCKRGCQDGTQAQVWHPWAAHPFCVLLPQRHQVD